MKHLIYVCLFQLHLLTFFLYDVHKFSIMYFQSTGYPRFNNNLRHLCPKGKPTAPRPPIGRRSSLPIGPGDFGGFSLDLCPQGGRSLGRKNQFSSAAHVLTSLMTLPLILPGIGNFSEIRIYLIHVRKVRKCPKDIDALISFAANLRFWNWFLSWKKLVIFFFFFFIKYAWAKKCAKY